MDVHKVLCFPSVHHQGKFGRSDKCLDRFHAMALACFAVVQAHGQRNKLPHDPQHPPIRASVCIWHLYLLSWCPPCCLASFLRCSSIPFRSTRTRASSRGKLDDTCARTSFVHVTTTMADACARSTTTSSHVQDDEDDDVQVDAVERIRDLRCASRRGETTRANDVRCATTWSESRRVRVGTKSRVARARAHGPRHTWPRRRGA